MFTASIKGLSTNKTTKDLRQFCIFYSLTIPNCVSFFLVNKDTTTNIANDKGIETIPGLSNGHIASVLSIPYLSNIDGESNINIIDDAIPVTIDAETPLLVVFFQKSIIIIAGRLADAATAKASPTKKETFIPWCKVSPRC